MRILSEPRNVMAIPAIFSGSNKTTAAVCLLLVVLAFVLAMHLQSPGPRDFKEQTLLRLPAALQRSKGTFDAREEILAKVEPEFRQRCKDIFLGAPKMFSQAYQDWILYHNFFRDYGYGEGFYIDIGSNNPFFISNTLFFEKCLGWKGLCVEPQSNYHPLYEKRKCTLVPNCLSQEEVEMGFTFDGVDGRVVPRDDPASNATLRCRPLQDILMEHGVKKVDFMSIDTEGAEVDILRCFPFSDWKIKALIVETNKQDKYLDFLLLRAGYMKVMELLCPTSEQRNVGTYLDSLFVWNDSPIVLPNKDQEFKCTEEDSKWNGCYSLMGWPSYHREEIGPGGQVKDWCPNEGVALSARPGIVVP